MLVPLTQGSYHIASVELLDSNSRFKICMTFGIEIEDLNFLESKGPTSVQFLQPEDSHLHVTYIQ